MIQIQKNISNFDTAIDAGAESREALSKCSARIPNPMNATRTDPLIVANPEVITVCTIIMVQ